MKRSFYTVGNIGYYAKRVLKDLDLRDPPIPYGPILEYFGIDLHWINPQMELEFVRRTGSRIETPAFLCSQNDSTKVFVRESDINERRRLSIFHECGHFDIPWHEGHDYLCDCPEINSEQHNKIEREAFEYAGKIIFPESVFYEDIRSMSTNMETIEIISVRYMASFSATANTYIKVNPRQCAILYLMMNPLSDETGFPFKVKYSVKSKHFHRYWSPGAEIRYHDLIANCFEYRHNIVGEIPASIFGSSKSLYYEVELRPYGPELICALLKIPDSQFDIFII